MITPYFTDEEIEKELLKDYKLLLNYLAKRREYLYVTLLKSRNKTKTRLIPWKSPSNNLWWTVEIIENKNREKSVTHGNRYCSYYFNGKLRICNMLDRADKPLRFVHYTYHFFCRLKERLNWKLSIEETAKKYILSNGASFAYTMSENAKDGRIPVLGISKFGMEFGYEESATSHRYCTTFIPIEMRKGGQHYFDGNLQKFMEYAVKFFNETEEEIDPKAIKQAEQLKEELNEVVQLYQNSARFINQQKGKAKGKK